MSPRFAFKFLLALAAATSARAQCPELFHPAPGGSALPDVSGGLVYAAATYDPDGAGPQVPRIVIGGSFTSAGGLPCNRIAQWDGTRWSPLGTGMENDVLALAVHNGELYAGGNFGTAGGVVVNCIARWNGTTWRAITSSGIAGVDGPVFALAEVQGTLYVGGAFLHTGSLNASRIARFTTSWFPMSSGVSSTVHALVADGSRVIVGGAFTTAGGQAASRVAAFDGTFWSPMGAGITGPVKALARFNNQIYAGGGFTTANGGATTVNGITRFNGTFWEAVGSGIAGSQVTPRISSMHIYNNRLHIGGLFDTAGGVTCKNIASFDGTGFQPLGGGVGPATADVFAMTQYQGSLVVAGAFTIAGDAASQPVALWNGAQWLQLQSQPNGPVNCLATCNGSLVAGGGFDFLTSPQVIAHNAVAYNEKGGVGTLQSPEGFTGTNGPVLAACAQTLSPVQPQSVVLAGDFGWANGIEVSNIVRLDQFGVPDSLGNGLNDTVRAVAMYQNMLYAAGDFLGSGGSPMSKIARYGGGIWQPLGAGIGGGTPYTIAVYNGDLYVGGDFNNAGGGLNTGGLARWNGIEWSNVGGYFFGTVRSLAVYNNKLIIAGSLPGYWGSANIVAWDGNAFSPLDAGLGTVSEGSVDAVASHNGQLYAAGTFSLPGVPVLVDLARWDGVAWHPVDTSITGGSIHTLQSYNNQLWLGGSFTSLGGQYVPNIARLYCDCYANCDGSTIAPVLTPNDFQCFLNQFAAGHAYANCDGSAGTPSLTPNDFQCYLNRFASGCP
jgi:trimeric autotransporter adhesin